VKIGAFAVLLADRPLDQALDYLRSLGLTMVEIGTGGYPGSAHANAAELLADPAKLQAFRQTVNTRGFQISALSWQPLTSAVGPGRP